MYKLCSIHATFPLHKFYNTELRKSKSLKNGVLCSNTTLYFLLKWLWNYCKSKLQCDVLLKLFDLRSLCYEKDALHLSNQPLSGCFYDEFVG
jgi:hypothetical protein